MDALIEIDSRVFNNLRADVGVDFMLEIVETYCEDAHQQIRILQSALDQGDAVAFTRAAHSIKLTSLTVGATVYGSLARDLEMLGREGRLEDCHDKIQQLKDACEPLSQALKGLCHGQS